MSGGCSDHRNTWSDPCFANEEGSQISTPQPDHEINNLAASLGRLENSNSATQNRSNEPKIVKLEMEIKLLKAINEAILDCLPQLLSAKAGVNADVAPLDSCIMGFTGFTELNPDDFPLVTYWNEGSYREAVPEENFEPGAKGGGRRANSENVNCPYIEGIDGTPVHGARLTSIMKQLRGI
ncbi:hypothetical protein PQX77_015758 [Marasmius sp. AFHP31]|nr:hypothetical protein PQX77_015758 [Marasmius sp. AFHP31]